MSLMTKPLVLAVVGGLAGIGVAAGLFFFVFSGGSAEEIVDGEPTPEPTAVHVEGRIGPHIVLEDRVFNLLATASAPRYLKLETLIEFETHDEEWEEVLHGCVRSLPSIEPATTLLVSALPVPAAPPAFGPGEAAGEGGGECALKEAALLAHFDEEIGTGRQLIEDAVTSIVTGKTVEEIATPAGKDALRVEIRHAVEALIPEPLVRRVLFTNFITQ